ncbi:type 1 glutamine amidotransferase [Sphaerisporangium fuscum]|uniref:type 1 glutamine amidotransferase n=1 Tax=Sphaerisporangium fuscum TaxID=2835868 RepID=UPI002029A81D|nr:type 1 glutamine amidotransferase [Sphaerisporangium fuscum]
MKQRVLIIEHEADAGLGFFAGWLAEAGLSYDVVRPYLGEKLPTLPPADPTSGRPASADFVSGGPTAGDLTSDGPASADLASGVPAAGDPVEAQAPVGGDGPARPDGVIVLGGAAAAWDDTGYPWLPATRDLIRRSVEARVPTLGICLGAQLMTLACGGKVERGAAGLEVGLGEISLLPAASDDPLFRALPRAVRAVQYHQDAMTALPPDAVPLATGTMYPNQAYRLGDRAWAVQFHPEATPEIFASWTASTTQEIAATGADPRALDADVLAARDELTKTWHLLADAFTKIVKAGRNPTGT